MEMTDKRHRRRRRLRAGAAAIAILSVAGFGASTMTGAPVLAQPVQVETPAAIGFADIVEKVSPAVVSVRVSSDVDDKGGFGGFFGVPGFEDLPDNHPFK